MTHEFLHSLDLLEIFQGEAEVKIGNNIKKIESPVVYKLYSTNNIMDYLEKNENNKQSNGERISLFSWQWKVINSSLKNIEPLSKSMEKGKN